MPNSSLGERKRNDVMTTEEYCWAMTDFEGGGGGGRVATDKVQV